MLIMIIQFINNIVRYNRSLKGYIIPQQKFKDHTKLMLYDDTMY
jgi:hypothetical protein